MAAFLKAAALLLVAIATAAPAEPPQKPIPVDMVARGKFPRDNPQVIDALAAFNRDVNATFTYVSDQEHYGVNDHYVSLPADYKGDCEDYALSKMELLSAAGFPTVTSAKLVTVIVHVGKDVFGHAILAVRLPSGAVAYLDMGDEPMTRKELEARGYEFFDWRA